MGCAVELLVHRWRRPATISIIEGVGLAKDKNTRRVQNNIYVFESVHFELSGLSSSFNQRSQLLLLFMPSFLVNNLTIII